MWKDLVTRNQCLVCDSKNVISDGCIDHRKIGHCAECGFSFVIEYSPAALEKYYAEDYYPEGEQNRKCADWIQKNIPVWQQLCQDIPSGSIKSLLDIGAGTGGFLQVFHKIHPETEIFASEPSPSARNFLTESQPYGHFAATPDVFKQKFQLISLLQVLEHIPDPYPMCRSIHTKLGNGGIFLLTVPNRNSYDVFFHGRRKSLCYGNPTHLQFFRRQDIMHLLKKCGFSQIRRVVSFGNGSGKHHIKQSIQYAMRQAGISTELRFLASR